ncbi:malate dehydrogenase [Rhodococcus rhodnii]|uniref:Malate dehydrogenase n=2 Tax=Rhodococcus rhodnii TaxID=38312 RepID=R7WJI4_9NOCA|nr:malate dehydrogenase [Rhodococcus rhodnii]EOM75452.1 malate dehydrogenase [Rhodococcus rhodnii LMG 5362]TXG90523.1 malate dehydrogenase [Rhodococcus rhodnii]
MSDTMTVTVTGAAGNIGYAALFRIAAGDMLGEGIRVKLRLLDLPGAVRAAEGTAMEIEDGAFALLDSLDVYDDARAAFDGTDIALLIGSRPRSKGMERADLLSANGAIFQEQGRAIADVASDRVRVLVVGNPANTNALVAAENAPGVPGERFTALTRLDHNRAIAQLGKHTGAAARDISRVTIWGNHSATQYPDIFHARVGDRAGADIAQDRDWLENDFVPTVARRGTAIIEARGSSSAASAANAAIDHVHDWVLGTPDGDWTSVALRSHGEYGVPEGLVCSFPATSDGGDWKVVEGLDLGEFARARIDASVAELVAERDAVRELGFA